MFRKTVTFILSVAMVLSLFSFVIVSADGPSDKSVYFSDNVAYNGTPAPKGNNIQTVISGDVLKILVTGKADPNFDIKLAGNVDTATYKILALKVKKEYAGAISGDIFYNVHGSGAEGGKSINFTYAEGTDYQWVYVDLSTKSVTQVGYLRYDVYGESPVEGNTLVTLAGIGFFKSVDDMNAYAASDPGKALGSDEGDMALPYKDVLIAGADFTPGVWLDTPTDETKPGYYWLKFNASKPFQGITFLLYASNNSPTGRWKLFKYDKNLETTLAGTPVATHELTPAGDGEQTALFGKMDPGQYVFYIEADDKKPGDKYFNIGIAKEDPDSKYFEVGFNGNNIAADGHKTMYAKFMFAEESTAYFNELTADENPPTGDVTLIGYGLAVLATALLKKRKVK